VDITSAIGKAMLREKKSVKSCYFAVHIGVYEKGLYRHSTLTPSQREFFHKVPRASYRKRQNCVKIRERNFHILDP
jgi:hypothetical protein